MKISKALIFENIKPRCRYCGKPSNNLNVYCSKECEKKDKELIEYRRKNKLCLNCGSSEIFKVLRDGVICKECLEKINYLFKKCEYYSKKFKKGFDKNA